MFDKKGIFLIYVLFTAVLISIFLITAVSNLHHNIFITSKFTNESKSYWAAESGIQYCEFKLKENLNWPFDNPKTGTEKFGIFTIKSSLEDNGNGYYIHGSSRNNGEFCIYFSKKNITNIIKKNDDDKDDAKEIIEISIIPDAFPSNPSNLSYCSYNSMSQKDTDNPSSTDPLENENTKTKFITSNTPIKHDTLITFPGIYIASDGRYGMYRTVLEKMITANYGNQISGGLYSAGNINIGLLGKNANFQLTQTDNSQPNIYCRRSLKLERAENNSSESNNKNYNFPFNLQNGTVFFTNSFDITDNTFGSSENKKIYSTNEGTSYKRFKKKYGINLAKYKESYDSVFPRLTWDDMQEVKKQKEEKIKKYKEEASANSNSNNKNKKQKTYNQNDTTTTEEIKKIESGTYVAIFIEDEQKYSLFRLNKNYLDRDGSFRENEFKSDLQKNSKPICQKIEKNIETLTDRKVIELFVNQLNGQNGGNGYICSEPSSPSNPDTQDTSQDISYDYKNIFEIKSITIGDKHNPLVTLKQSVEITNNNSNGSEDKGYFNLITLNSYITRETITIPTENDNQDNKEKKENETISNINVQFGISKSSYTNLFLAHQEIAKKDKENDSNNTSLFKIKDDKTKEDTTSSQNVTAPEGVMLYTDGYVSINGKIFGSGEIISGGSVYFKAGSQINAVEEEVLYSINGETTEKTDEDDTETENETTIKSQQNEDIELTSNSEIAIYSKGTVQIGIPESNSFVELENKIQEKLIGLFANSHSEIATNVLNSNIKIDEKYAQKLEKELGINILPQEISLKNFMTNYYGYSESDSTNYLETIVRQNATLNTEKNIYEMPKNVNDIHIQSTTPSNFKGIIYACGGFKCNAEKNALKIDGILVTYGSDPNSDPGKGINLNNKDLLGITDGSIKVENCNNFSITYNNKNTSTFDIFCVNEPILNLNCIYFNKIQ